MLFKTYDELHCPQPTNQNPMMQSILEHNLSLARLPIFIGMFIVMASLEAAWPRRERQYICHKRWLCNFACIGFYTLIIRILISAALVSSIAGFAMMLYDRSWGIFNMIDLPIWANVILSLLLLDMAIYWQHRLFHMIPFLWRFHRMHHADQDLDASTGIRFHPVEMMLSYGYKIACISLLGSHLVAVLIFEIMLNASAIFSHANVSIPTKIEAALRRVMVTPDMHRVHHSMDVKEHDSNYGFCLSVWDRIFGSYRSQPNKGHCGMDIGLKAYADLGPSQFKWCMLLPFKTLVKESPPLTK